MFSSGAVAGDEDAAGETIDEKGGRVMSDIEIGIDVSLTCDDCGAVLDHKKVRMTNLCAEIEVYRCENCREVEQKEYREDHHDVINELEKQITRLIDELRQAKTLDEK
jgi:predicted RNA-binding Zn-ribbon protein involved in translation (DUF1610 family)